MPLISIITPAYNASRTIADAITSVQSQTFQDWEMIIVDDSSGDGTGAIVERFAADDRRIRLIRRAENNGSAAARNAGLKAAHGRYIAFLDADDLWLPEKLVTQLAFMQDNIVAASYHAYRRITLNGKPGRLLRGPARVTFDTLLHRNSVETITVMLDRDMVGPVQFDTTLSRRDDLALWLNVTKAGHDIVLLDSDLARDRIIPGRTLKNFFRSAMGTWRVYRDVAGLRIRQTFAAMFSYAFFAAIKRIG